MARIKVFDKKTQTWVYADKSFGKDGKSAYDYAKDGGFTGTETEFIEKMANGIPTKVSELTNDSGFISNDDILNVNGTLKNDVLPEGYPYMGVGEVLPETIVSIDPDVGQGMILDEFELHIGNSYIVNYNGTEYSCEAQSFILENIEFVALGNVGVMDESGETELTNEPFLLVNVPNSVASSIGWYGGLISLDGLEEIIFSIHGNVIKKISKDFLPNINSVNNLVDGSELGSVRSIGASDVIGMGAHAEGWCTTASGDYSHAEGRSDSNAFDYITRESTQEEIIAAWNENLFTLANGDNSHAEGYNTLALNNNSHAEGSHTKASGSQSHTEGDHTTASNDNSHAEGYYTTASGVSSHTEGDHTTASNDNSHAEGYYTTAEGRHSHAEGSNTTAFGIGSHAEGYSDHNAFDLITRESTKEEIVATWVHNQFTLANGNHSHAEGYNTLALGEDSHAEGYQTRSSGIGSHAEGDGTIASGGFSHAEGDGTMAYGEYSHAEGGNTLAYGQYSHVQGKYNIEDAKTQYAHIVGNGSSSARSNAHTLDWEGNAWFAGDVYVGSTSGANRDEGSKKLATEEFVNNKGYLTSFTETDPTVPAWAKASTKPTYTAAEVGALAADTLPTAINTALTQAKASGEFDGTSVTVKSVSESTIDGGSNVITFSDGKTLTVKNGSKGNAYTLTDADKSTIVNAVIAALPVYNGEVI